MLSQLKNIEQEFIAAGQKICFGEQETISKEGEPCGTILYLPQNTLLDCDGREVELKAGAYLHFKEYFMNQIVQHTLTTLQATQAILFESSTIEMLKHSNHLFQLFFIQKLSQQATTIHAKFE